MLLHLPIVVMATVSPLAISDTVPKFDIVRECRFGGGSTVEFDRCTSDEGVALRALQQAWAQFAGGDRRNCIASATIGGFAATADRQGNYPDGCIHPTAKTSPAPRDWPPSRYAFRRC
jgi:hypothetical protein